MVYKEDVSDLYLAFNDRLQEDGKEQKIIKCQICCLEGPSHSKRSTVCEMCFDDDFWAHQQNNKKDKESRMWALKTIKSGIIGRIYCHRDEYWSGSLGSQKALSHASLFNSKTEALRAEEEIVAPIADDANAPQFKIVELVLYEV